MTFGVLLSQDDVGISMGELLGDDHRLLFARDRIIRGVGRYATKIWKGR
jgi:hypothetical protein